MGYVVGLSGSPRRDGTTERLLDEVLRSAASRGARTDKIVLNELGIRPCQACGGCDKTGFCVIDDGMTDVYKRVMKADGIVVASPLYFASVSAQTKSAIDRFQCEWVRRFVLKTAGDRRVPGFFICAAASASPDLFDHARKVVRVFFKSIGVAYSGELFCAGTDGKNTDPVTGEAAGDARRIGEALAEGKA